MIKAARMLMSSWAGRFLTPRVMAELPKLQAIITYSVGYDTVDVDAATKNQIIIVNNPAAEWCVAKSPITPWPCSLPAPRN